MNIEQNNRLPVVLTILLIGWTGVALTAEPAPELMEKAKKCADELHDMYDQLCTATKGDGVKVVEIKKKCIQYPEKLAAQKEVVLEFEKCNVAKDVCNKDLMKKCGENHFTIADKLYQESKSKDKDAPNLAALALNNMANVLETCEKSKACMKGELSGDPAVMMEKSKKCAEEMELMYEKLCTTAKGDGTKVVDIKKKCVKYPEKLASLTEVVAEFEKCNIPNDVCNKDAMKKCGEDHYKIADKLYMESKGKDPEAPNLAAMALNNMDNVYNVCEESKACMQEEMEPNADCPRYPITWSSLICQSF